MTEETNLNASSLFEKIKKALLELGGPINSSHSVFHFYG
jgi:hypothetical protein